MTFDQPRTLLRKELAELSQANRTRTWLDVAADLEALKNCNY